MVQFIFVPVSMILQIPCYSLALNCFLFYDLGRYKNKKLLFGIRVGLVSERRQ